MKKATASRALSRPVVVRSLRNSALPSCAASARSIRKNLKSGSSGLTHRAQQNLLRTLHKLSAVGLGRLDKGEGRAYQRWLRPARFTLKSTCWRRSIRSARCRGYGRSREGLIGRRQRHLLRDQPCSTLRAKFHLIKKNHP